MKKALFAVTAAFILAIALAPVRLASAQEDESEILTCEFTISIDLESGTHWEGKIWGDINGILQLWERPSKVVGKVMHYFEDWVILTDNGAPIIKGVDKGIWTYSTYKFRSHGPVTWASEDWSYLVGYQMTQMGFTDPLPLPEGTTLLTGSGTMMLVPA